MNSRCIDTWSELNRTSDSSELLDISVTKQDDETSHNYTHHISLDRNERLQTEQLSSTVL